MFVGIGFITVPIVILSYIRINKKRDEVQRVNLENGTVKKYTNQQLREMGDRAPDFRYTLWTMNWWHAMDEFIMFRKILSE